MLIIISGSTDVALRVTKGHEILPQLIDLSGVYELQSIQETADTLTLGAGIILNDVHQAVKKNFSGTPRYFIGLWFTANQECRYTWRQSRNSITYQRHAACSDGI